MSTASDKTATLTRQDLIKRLTLETGNATIARSLVNSFFAHAEKILLEKGQLKMHNFGTFETTQKRARVGRNPRSGEELEITARKVVRFRPSNKLRDLVRSAGIDPTADE